MKENIRPQNPLGFIAGTLPQLVKGKTAFNAIFSSYNSIGMYPPGPFITGKPGLNILISSGGCNLRIARAAVGMAAIASGLAAMESFNAEEQRCARRAQEKMAQSIAEKEKLDEDLAVVYAGRSAPAQALEFAEEIKARSPKAFIAIVTCDCGLRDKTSIFAAKAALMDALVVSPICGGASVTGGILDALVDLWPDQILSN